MIKVIGSAMYFILITYRDKSKNKLAKLIFNLAFSFILQTIYERWNFATAHIDKIFQSQDIHKNTKNIGCFTRLTFYMLPYVMTIH